MNLGKNFEPELYEKYRKSFANSLSIENANKTIYMGFIGLFFFVVIMVLDIMRLQKDMFEDRILYVFLFVCHILFGLMSIPGMVFYFNRIKLNNGEFQHLRLWLNIYIFMVIITMLPLGVMGIPERGTLTIFAVYILLVNLILNLPLKLKITANVVGFIAVLFYLFVLFEGQALRLYLYMIDTLAVIVPIYFIGFLQLRFKFNNFINEKIIEEQKIALEKEKETSDRLLLNILPKSIADELKSKGFVESRLYEDATIMFLDFKSFTRISQGMTPIELVSELNEYFVAFDKVMDKYDIEKIKTIGDAYMCVSGIPDSNPNHALNMIAAAKEILEFINQMKDRKQSENKPFFEARIGIHSGTIVAGVVGKLKFAYDVWGDAVNTASRIEHVSEVGCITCSENTYQLLKATEQFEFLEKQNVKDIGEVVLYKLS